MLKHSVLLSSLCSHIFLVLRDHWLYVCLHLKMEFRSCARGRQWCGIFHYHWWTASIKPRLLFSHSGLVSWGLLFLQFVISLCCKPYICDRLAPLPRMADRNWQKLVEKLWKGGNFVKMQVRVIKLARCPTLLMLNKCMMFYYLKIYILKENWRKRKSDQNSSTYSLLSQAKTHKIHELNMSI